MEISNEELAIRIGGGEPELVQQLWTQVERFAAMQARKYYRRIQGHMDAPLFEVEDLTQEAYFALLNAVERFDATRGGFLGIFELCLKTAFSRASGNRTSAQRHDGLKRSVSGDVPVNEEGDTSLFDLIPADEESAEILAIEPLYQQQLHDTLESALKKLPQQQESILRDYYYCDLTCDAIASNIGCSISNVSDLRRKALCSLYDSKQLNGLSEYIDANTNFYQKVGVRQFKSTGTSAVEAIVERREQLAAKWLKQHGIALTGKGGGNGKVDKI